MAFTRKKVDDKKKVTKFATYPDDEQLRQAYLLCARHGCTNQDLADMFGVNKGDISSWYRRGREALVNNDPNNPFAKFLLACKSGADEFNSENIEKALVKRANGFTITNKETQKTTVNVKTLRNLGISVPDHLIHNGEVVYATTEKVIEKEVPPETKAIQFYLSNRTKERWNMFHNQNDPRHVDHRHLHAFIGGVNDKKEKLNPSKLNDSQLAVIETAVKEQDNESD